MVRFRSLASLPARCLCIAATLAFTCGVARADDDVGKGFGLDRYMGVSGVFGFGNRYGDSGKSVAVRFEGAGYFLQTPFGNRGGIEGGMEMGWDGFNDHEPSALLSGFLWDMWLGFPITVFEKRDDTGPLFSAVFAPGMGASWQHAYVYIKGKAGMRVSDAISVELSYQWTPYMGSVPWADNVVLTDGQSFHPKVDSGLSMATLRATAFLALNKDLSLFGFFDWKQSNLEIPTECQNTGAQTGTTGSSSSCDPALNTFSSGIYKSSSFLPLTRLRVDNAFHLGFGLAF